MPDSIPLSDLRAGSRPNYIKMPDSSPSPQPRAGRWGVKRDRSWTISLIGSYVFDWIVLLAVAAVGGVLAIIEPNKRHFSLLDPNIAYGKPKPLVLVTSR